MNAEEAQRIIGPNCSVEWSPIRPSRWSRLHLAALAKSDIVVGSPFQDFHKDLFTWDYRLYRSEDCCTILAPLLCSETGQQTRTWCLLDRQMQLLRALSEAKAGIPPYHPSCSVGPDGRLPRALARLKEAPEKLQLNHLTHQRGEGERLMRSGLPFCVGNMAAPRSGDKQAAFSILRMPVFGASFGVRSRVDQPLGGEEVSAGCIGSVDNAAMSVLDNETRRVRQVKDSKEPTALLNKKATQKAGLAEVPLHGRCIYGPSLREDFCHKHSPGSRYFCMGVLSAESKCSKCRAEHCAASLFGKKRLLDDAGSLQVSKKMRLKELPPKHHVIVRGSRCYDIVEMARDLDGGGEEGASLTKIPDDCRLSPNREIALAFPVDTVYFLGKKGCLQDARDPRNLLGRASYCEWLLPSGHYILCEKFRVPRGREHLNEVVEPTASEELSREIKRQRLKDILASHCDEEESGEDSNEDRYFDRPFARIIGPWEDAVMREIKASKELEEHLEAFEVPSFVARRDDCHDCQLDYPLTGLDFVVHLLEGRDYLAEPQLVAFGAPLRSLCSCGMPSLVSLLRNASEEERCIMASRTFHGSYSTLCSPCLEAKRKEALQC